MPRLHLRPSPWLSPEVRAAIRRDLRHDPGPIAPEDWLDVITAGLAGDPGWRLVLAEDDRGQLGGYAVWHRAGRVAEIALVGAWGLDLTLLPRLIRDGQAWGAEHGATVVRGLARHRPRAWARLTGCTHCQDLWLVEAA